MEFSTALIKLLRIIYFFMPNYQYLELQLLAVNWLCMIVFSVLQFWRNMVLFFMYKPQKIP